MEAKHRKDRNPKYQEVQKKVVAGMLGAQSLRPKHRRFFKTSPRLNLQIKSILFLQEKTEEATKQKEDKISAE
jgi:hypothetical protein